MEGKKIEPCLLTVNMKRYWKLLMQLSNQGSQLAATSHLPVQRNSLIGNSFHLDIPALQLAIASLAHKL